MEILAIVETHIGVGIMRSSRQTSVNLVQSPTVDPRLFACSKALFAEPENFTGRGGRIGEAGGVLDAWAHFGEGRGRSAE